MAFLSVTGDWEGSTGLTALLDVQDIVFLEYDGRYNKVAIHTVEDEYYLTGTLKYWVHTLNSSGGMFLMVDRHCAVNAAKIKVLNALLRVGYFVDKPDQTSKFCTMSNSGYREVVDKVKELQYAVAFV